MIDFQVIAWKIDTCCVLLKRSPVVWDLFHMDDIFSLAKARKDRTLSVHVCVCVCVTCIKFWSRDGVEEICGNVFMAILGELPYLSGMWFYCNLLLEFLADPNNFLLQISCSWPFQFGEAKWCNYLRTSNNPHHDCSKVFSEWLDIELWDTDNLCSKNSFCYLCSSPIFIQSRPSWFCLQWLSRYVLSSR